MFKRLLITAASVAALGCALVSCGDSGAGTDKPLRWRTVVDVPVNFTLPVDFGALPFPDLRCESFLPELSLFDPTIDCDSLSDTQKELLQSLKDKIMDSLPPYFILGIGKDTINAASQVMNALKKLDSLKINYSVGVQKGTDMTFAVYGMFVPIDDTNALNAKDSVFYKKCDGDSTIGTRVNVFGSTGLTVKDTVMSCYPEPCGNLPRENPVLNDLVFNTMKFSSRWIVKLDKSQYEILGRPSAMEDTVHIRLRINLSGVNSVDSLFKMFD